MLAAPESPVSQQTLHFDSREGHGPGAVGKFTDDFLQPFVEALGNSRFVGLGERNPVEGRHVPIEISAADARSR